MIGGFKMHSKGKKGKHTGKGKKYKSRKNISRNIRRKTKRSNKKKKTKRKNTKKRQAGGNNCISYGFTGQSDALGHATLVTNN